jgi:hypothetical protein
MLETQFVSASKQEKLMRSYIRKKRFATTRSMTFKNERNIADWSKRTKTVCADSTAID